MNSGGGDPRHPKTAVPCSAPASSPTACAELPGWTTQVRGSAPLPPDSSPEQGHPNCGHKGEGASRLAGDGVTGLGAWQGHGTGHPSSLGAPGLLGGQERNMVSEASLCMDGAPGEPHSAPGALSCARQRQPPWGVSPALQRLQSPGHVRCRTKMALLLCIKYAAHRCCTRLT